MAEVWSNWSGEQACVPAVLARPRSTADVVAEVQRAAQAGRVVRVAGAGHSFTDAVITEGTLLSLDAMDAVLDADRATGRVRVQAGIRIHALSDRLAELGLALENLGDVNVQSIAGAISTGTHGTGAELPNISAAVEAVQLVAGDGTVHELDGGDELLAARVAVGALGVITEVTLRCVPLFTLRGLDEPRPLADVLDGLDELAGASRHFEFFVFPHTRVALTRTNDVVDGPPRPDGPVRRYVDDVLLGNHAFGAACDAGRRVPRAIPRINRAVASGFSRRERVDRADRIFASPRLVRFTEMELAYPREAAREVVERVLETAGASRSTSRSRCASSPATTRCSARRAGARPPTSRSTTRAECRGRRTSAPCRRSATSTTRARTGASATSRPPRRSRRATRGGSASRPCARGWTPTGASRTRTLAGRSVERVGLTLRVGAGQAQRALHVGAVQGRRQLADHPLLVRAADADDERARRAPCAS
jgi:L-gulonolactone oxidase